MWCVSRVTFLVYVMGDVNGKWGMKDVRIQAAFDTRKRN